MRKNKIGKIQIAVLLTVIASSAIPLIYALSVLWSAQSSVTITDTIELGVYTDSACTTPVHSVDFGSQKKGAYAYKTLFLKNTGTADITLDWSSNAPTSILAGDDWIYKTGSSWMNIKGYVLKVGGVLETKYEIFILPNAPTGSKTWTLNLGTT